MEKKEKGLRKIRNFFNVQIIVTMLLLLFLIVSTGITMTIFKARMEEVGLETAWDSVDNLILKIRSSTENDQEQLKTLARIIGMHKELDSPHVKNALAAFDEAGMITDVYLLMPDNRLLTQKGTFLSDDYDLDFDTEFAKGAYISKRADSFLNVNEKLIYYTEPVYYKGIATGVLYGVVRLQHMADSFRVEAFGGDAAVYITEGETGNFLLDTWHGTFTGLDELGPRETKPGYDHNQFLKDIRACKTGKIILLSKTLNEYVYICYKGVGINDWSVALHLAEPTLYKEFEYTNQVQMVYIVAMLAAIGIYLVWFLAYNGAKSAEREMELNQVTYMSRIQRTLFDVHRNQEHMQEALRQLGEKLQAKTTFFIEFEGDRVKRIHSWSTDGQKITGELLGFPNIIEQLSTTGNYRLFNLRKLKKKAPEEYAVLQEQNVRNMMMTLVQREGEAAVGVLGALNMSQLWQDTRYLDSVGISFFCACENIDNQETIDEMATVDMLTGLLNRNRYEDDLKRYQKEAKIPDACIFVDVDGLHDLNNSLGHAAGDEMLCFVAKAVRRTFDSANTYRIGGDEFLIFVFDKDAEEIEAGIDEIKAEVEANDYHVSIGVEYSIVNRTMDGIVAEAEKHMYEEKREYYRLHKNVGKERQMNRKLEKILQEKRDMDMFLSLLAPDYVGVYVVDLERNTSRAIQIPEEYKELFDGKAGSFTEIVDIYISTCVAERDQERIRQAVQYDNIVETLEHQGILHLNYNKKDGSVMPLHIYRTAEYNADTKVTIWLFEKYGMKS